MILISRTERDAIQELLKETLRGHPEAVLQQAIIKLILLFVRAQDAGLLMVVSDGEQI